VSGGLFQDPAVQVLVVNCGDCGRLVATLWSGNGGKQEPSWQAKRKCGHTVTIDVVDLTRALDRFERTRKPIRIRG
jgi:hypothetical protein